MSGTRISRERGMKQKRKREGGKERRGIGKEELRQSGGKRQPRVKQVDPWNIFSDFPVTVSRLEARYNLPFEESTFIKTLTFE